jgi:hypothetical protein
MRGQSSCTGEASFQNGMAMAAPDVGEELVQNSQPVERHGHGVGLARALLGNNPAHRNFLFSPLHSQSIGLL